MILTQPAIAGRSCADCQLWIYDDRPGGLSGQRSKRPDGEPIPRPATVKTPCQLCPKIPRGVPPCPGNAIEMSDRNRRAYWHYLRCKAVGQFPDDPIVRRNAGLIRMVEDDVEGQRTETPLSLLLTMLARPK